MLKTVIEVGVPVLIFVAMFVVGTDLTPDDFRLLARRPATVLAAIAGPVILLPVIAWLLVRCFGLQPAVTQGVLFVAACPSGSMANVYTYLARANVSLSVTLTAASCLLAVLTTPLALAALQSQIGDSTGISVPSGVLAVQLSILLILPVVVGMGARRCWPEQIKRHGRALLGLGTAALAIMLAFVIAQEAAHFANAITEIAAATCVLTVLAFAAGWGTGWAVNARVSDRFTLGMVFVVRNVGIATAIAVTALGKPEFAVFATAYFLLQAPILLAAVYLFRRLRISENNNLAGAHRP